MRILVTGGAGYIGSHAVRLFLARGHDVWVYDNLSLGHRAAVPADRLIHADLSEVHRLERQFYLSSSEQHQVAELKKEKLLTKDRLAKLSTAGP